MKLKKEGGQNVQKIPRGMSDMKNSNLRSLFLQLYDCMC